MKKYSTPLVTASDVVAETQVGPTKKPFAENASRITTTSMLGFAL